MAEQHKTYFNSQPREGGWQREQKRGGRLKYFNSQPREGGWFLNRRQQLAESISTHSRAKAAGHRKAGRCQSRVDFNSQPREGGWRLVIFGGVFRNDFNSQPREGGWALFAGKKKPRRSGISTHSRAKAAGPTKLIIDRPRAISTHSRAKAAGQSQSNRASVHRISTHSRAKAAGHAGLPIYFQEIISTHSRAKAAGGEKAVINSSVRQFQLTAARRRLAILNLRGFGLR